MYAPPGPLTNKSLYKTYSSNGGTVCHSLHGQAGEPPLKTRARWRGAPQKFQKIWPGGDGPRGMSPPPQEVPEKKIFFGKNNFWYGVQKIKKKFFYDRAGRAPGGSALRSSRNRFLFARRGGHRVAATAVEQRPFSFRLAGTARVGCRHLLRRYPRKKYFFFGMGSRK